MTQVPHGPAPTPLAWPPSPLPLLHRLGEAADAPADAGARVRPSDKGSSPFSRSQSPSGAAPDLAARIPRRVPRASPRALRRTAIARRVPSSPSAMKKAICTHFGGWGGGRSPLEDQTHAGRGTQKDFKGHKLLLQTTVTWMPRNAGTRPARALLLFRGPAASLVLHQHVVLRGEADTGAENVLQHRPLLGEGVDDRGALGHQRGLGQVRKEHRDGVEPMKVLLVL